MRSLFAVVSLLVFMLPAEARHRFPHRTYCPHCHQAPHAPINRPILPTRWGPIANAQIVGGRPSGCPRAFCGCGTSLRIFGRIVDGLNLAANWFRFPPAEPAPGMVAVRAHHVFAIERVLGGGRVLAYDPNSGRGLTRIHEVSLRGYSVRNPHGG